MWKITVIAGLMAMLILFNVREGCSATIFSGIGQGDEVWGPDGRSSGMGGVGIAILDGRNFVRENPAVLGSFRNVGMSVLFRTELRNAKDRFAENRLTDGDMGYFRIVLPHPKGIVFRFGVEPVTAVNFDFSELGLGGGAQDTVKLQMRGGIQAISFGLGARLKEDRLFLGANLDAIITGTIQETWTRIFEDPSIFPSVDVIDRQNRGTRWTVGMAYNTKKHYSFGAFLTPRTTLEQTQILETRFGLIQKSSIDVDLPASFGLGGAYSDPGGKWMAAADMRFSLWEDIDPNRYRNAYGFAAGISYITGEEDPLGKSFRIPLRFGVKRKVLQYAGLPGGKDAVGETGVSLGAGIPFQRNWGIFELSFEVGKRGSVDKNGAQEVFFRQTFSIVGWPK